MAGSMPPWSYLHSYAYKSLGGVVVMGMSYWFWLLSDDQFCDCPMISLVNVR